MHEASVAEQILQTVEAHAQGRQVECIHLRVGRISGVVIDSLEFWLRLLLEEKNTPQTRVEFEDVPVKIQCLCGKEYAVENMTQTCPYCGEYGRTILQGRECMVESIEVDDEQNHSN